MNRLLPYAPLVALPELEVSNVVIDGEALPKVYLDTQRRAVNIASLRRETWREADIELTVRLPVEELQERVDISAPAVIVRINCDATNTRQSVVLPFPKAAAATASMRMPQTEYAERGVVEAFVVSFVDTDRSESPRILAACEPWVIEFGDRLPVNIDETRHRRRTGKKPLLDPVWVNFASPPDKLPFLKPFERELYYLDIASDPPQLYLNASIENFRILLDAEGRPSGSVTEKALRNSEMRGIAVPAWITLFHAAAAGLIEELGQQPTIPPDWKGEVLNALLPRVYGGRSALESIRLLAEALSDRQSDGRRTLEGALHKAVLEFLSVGAATAKDLRTLEVR
jgi:uncharacterized OB-fold protein